MNPAPHYRIFFNSLFFLTLTAGFALAVIGCKPDALVRSDPSSKGSSPNSSVGRGSNPVEAPIAGGSETINGTVAYSGKLAPKVRIDTSMDPACSLSGGDIYAEQYAVTNGKLANVFVYVKSGPPALMHAGPTTAQPVILDQKDCRYMPHTIGVVRGGTVEFRNSDPTMHNIHTMPTVVGNEVIDVSQGPRGAPQTKRFDKPELMMPVRCNNHPWMNAFINVSETPFFAVTDSSGRFELHGLLPGDYELGAVHEKLGEQTIRVSIQPQVPAKIDFSFAAH